jgi:hypothetical protein
MVRQIRGFTIYVQDKDTVTLEAVWEAASHYYE